MRKFKTCRPRTLAFRLLVIAAGALMLMAVFAPRANAQIAAYFNFEDGVDGTTPPDFTSEADQGIGIATTISTNYEAGIHIRTEPNFTAGENRVPGDIDNPPFGLHSMVLANTSANNGTHFDIPLFTLSGIQSTITWSFAYSNHGNGFSTATFEFSTNGGATFNSFAGNVQPMITGGVFIVSQTFPVAAQFQPNLILRMILTGGTSSGNDPQTEIDNIVIGGLVIPEPTTIAGGLLGVLGLCWHQRRRLRFLVPRFRRA